MSIARNTLVQSGMTLISRILGLVRDVFLASRIGAGPVGDAFYTALMFPNLFRRVFAEGAFAQAFVPTYARTLEAEGEAAAKAVAQQTFRALFALTALVTIIAQLAMPVIMLLIHGGYRNDPVHFPLAIALAQITMPYLSFMALSALLSGVLNSQGRFALSAGAPTLLNLCLLGAALAGGSPTEVAFNAAMAVAVSGALQVFLLWWGVRRQGISLVLGIPKISPAVKRVAALAVPGTIAASGTQLNIIISQSLASFETGAKTWLVFADRLYQLPLGLVGVAVGIAILPRLARAARSEDGASSTRTMDEALALAMALTLPATVALLAIPYHLIADIFARGEFTTEDARQSAQALFHFAWGVPAFVLVKVLAPIFFAREDTVTPMRFALWSVLANTVIGASLFFWLKSLGVFGFPGLAIATSTAAWLNVILLAGEMLRRNYYRPSPHLLSRLTRIALASVLMGLTLLLLEGQHDAITDMLFGAKELTIVAICGAAAVVYGVAALMFGAIRLQELKGLLRRSPA